MQHHFFVLGTDHVENDVTAILIHSFSIAKPFETVFLVALDYRLRTVDSTVSTGVRGKGIEVVGLNNFLFCDLRLVHT